MWFLGKLDFCFSVCSLKRKGIRHFDEHHRMKSSAARNPPCCQTKTNLRQLLPEKRMPSLFPFFSQICKPKQNGYSQNTDDQTETENPFCIVDEGNRIPFFSYLLVGYFTVSSYQYLKPSSSADFSVLLGLCECFTYKDFLAL